MDRNKFPGKVVFIRKDNPFGIGIDEFKNLTNDQREDLVKQLQPNECKVHSVVSRSGIYDAINEFNNGISPEEWFCGIMD
jgi:ribonuclease HII